MREKLTQLLDLQNQRTRCELRLKRLTGQIEELSVELENLQSQPIPLVKPRTKRTYWTYQQKCDIINRYNKHGTLPSNVPIWYIEKWVTEPYITKQDGMWVVCNPRHCHLRRIAKPVD